jgi:hypothetical protein
MYKTLKLKFFIDHMKNIKQNSVYIPCHAVDAMSKP